MAANRTSAGVGLVSSQTGAPPALVQQRAGVRQAPHVPHLHLQVEPCLQDVHGLVVGDDDEALAVHLQDLLTHLQDKTAAMKVQDRLVWRGHMTQRSGPNVWGRVGLLDVLPEFFRLGPEGTLVGTFPVLPRTLQGPTSPVFGPGRSSSEDSKARAAHQLQTTNLWAAVPFLGLLVRVPLARGPPPRARDNRDY